MKIFVSQRVKLNMLNFSDINENQEETESVTENGLSNGKEMNNNNNN